MSQNDELRDLIKEMPNKFMFHIVVGDGNNMQVDNASVPVRWCLNEKTIELLKEANVSSYVVLTALHPRKRGNEYEWIPMSRSVVPVTDTMTYLNINRPGKFTIVADIITPQSKKRNIIAKNLEGIQRRSTKSYNFGRVLCGTYDGLRTPTDEFTITTDELEAAAYFEDFDSFLRNMYRSNKPRSVVAAVECECDPQLFAGELPEWFDSWINMPFSTPPLDQCSRRRRTMLWLGTFWALPTAYIIITFLKTLYVSLWYVFLGGIRPNWKNVFKLKEFDVAPRYSDDSIYYKHPPLMAIHPILTIIYMVVGFLYYNHPEIRNWVHIGLVGLVGIALLVGIGMLIAFGKSTIARVARTVVAPFAWPFVKFADGVNYCFAKFEKWLLERERRLMDNLTCGGDPFTIIADPAKIPKPNKTLKLRLKDLKSKVCKPTAL